MYPKLQPTARKLTFFESYHTVEIRFPKRVVITKSQFIYTALTFAAETGGWIGILLGLSVFDVYDAASAVKIPSYVWK